MDKDQKHSRRVHYEKAAERGSAGAIAALQGPDYPLELRYLYEWAAHLVGRSGVGMAGYAPLSYGTIRDWMDLTGTMVYSHEVDALIQLDAVMRNPED